MAKQTTGKRVKNLGKGITWREDRQLYCARLKSSFELNKNGKPKVFEHCSKSLDDCRQWLLEKRYEEEHHIVKPKDMTVQQLWDEWHEFRSEKVEAGTLARNTVRIEEERWKMNIGPALSKMNVHDVHHADCERVITKMEKKGYAVGTCYQALLTMMTMFKYAKGQRIITDAEFPADGIVLKKDPNVRPKAMTVDEEEKFVAAIPEKRAPEYIFLLLTGLRAGECIALRWSDVHLDGEFPHIHINKSMEYRYAVGEWVEHVPKHHEIRDVPLCEEAVKLLKRQKERKLFRKCKDNKYEDFVFLDFRTGEPRKNSTYDTFMDRMCKKAGIPHYSVHGLRHTFATRCVEDGVKPESLSKILGHKSIKTTLDLYYEEKKDHTIQEFSKFSGHIGEKYA